MSCIDLLGRTWSPPVDPTAAPPDQPASKAAAPDLPDPPALTGGPLTVDEAWAIFGVAQKRAPRDEVKRRYLAFVSRWHPDKHLEDQSAATAQLVRANAAYALLQKHCRW